MSSAPQPSASQPSASQPSAPQSTAPPTPADLGLTGKRALITGATKGIGADIARTLAAHGAHLILTGRDKSELDSAAAELAESYGVQTAALVADLADPAAPARLATDATAVFGGLDILINNAGVSFPETVTGLDASHFDATIAINLRAPAILAAEVGKILVEQGAGGAIVTVASAAALAPLPEHYAYCASKAGLIMATKVLAQELGAHGIRANSVCPTVVLTEMGQRVWGEEAKAAPMLARIPLGRFAQPYEVSDAVAWLCSDGASMVNGVDLPIDGGYVMG